MRKILLACFVCLACQVPLIAYAAVIEGLYDAKVEISSQSSSEQKKAARRALSQVLVKVSGDDALLKDTEVKRFLNRAQDLLLAYQFDVQPDKLFYTAQFDRNKVQALLRATGFPIWGKHRPESLLWLVVEDPDTQQKVLLADGTQSEWQSVVFDSADMRGINIGFPVMDITDLQQVNLYDVWSGNTQHVIQASNRYDSEYVLTARLYYRSAQDIAAQKELLAKLAAQKQQALLDTQTGDAQNDGSDNPTVTGPLNSETAPTVPEETVANLDRVENHPQTPVTSVLENAGDQAAHVDGSAANAGSESSFTQAAINAFETVEGQADVWVLEWVSHRQGNYQTGEITDADPQLAIETLVNRLSDNMARQYAISSDASGDNNAVELVINNVFSLSAYAEVTDFVRNLSMVVDVSLVHQQGDSAKFSITLFGDAQNLFSAFELDDRLQKPQDNFGQPLQDEPYVWVPR